MITTMDITFARYDRDESGYTYGIKSVIGGVEMFVPIDPANRHYAEILRQVEAGELTIENSGE